MDNFDHTVRKTGAEPLHDNGQLLDTNLLAFWQWSASDLVNNALRGRLAEYLVAYALGVADGIRVEWDAYDLKTATGCKVEVKSAAYLQSWQQTTFSAITFGIRPTFAWDAETNTYSCEQKRQADVYVFALLAHRDKATIDPLNVAQWQFYVLPVGILNAQLPVQKTISLATIQRLGATPAQFSELRAVVEARSAE
jgi:hypothetical protein